MNIENVTNKVNSDVTALMVKLKAWGCLDKLGDNEIETITGDIKRISANAVLHYNNEVQDLPTKAYKAILAS